MDKFFPYPARGWFVNLSIFLFVVVGCSAWYAPFAWGQTDSQVLVETMRKELVMTKAMLSAAEQIMAKGDPSGKFTAYLAAKNHQIQSLQKEVMRLREAQAPPWGTGSQPQAASDKGLSQADKLQKQLSQTLEKLNDVQSDYASLKHDYQNNIDKLAIYAEENDRLTAKQNQFYLTRRKLENKIDELQQYNKELGLTKKSVMAQIKKMQPDPGEVGQLTAQVESLQKKLAARNAETKKLVLQKKELLKKLDEVNRLYALQPPAGSAETDNPFKQEVANYKSEIKRLEEALNRKETYYNNLVRENDQLHQHIDQLSVGHK